MPTTPTKAKLQSKEKILNSETAFALKADPLLQLVRRAATTYPSPAQSSAITPASDIDAFSAFSGVTREADGRTRISLTVSLESADAVELIAAGFSVGAVVGDVATIETDVERLAELATLQSVARLSMATRSYASNDLSRRAIGVDDTSGHRTLPQTGSGVIVAIIDDGIDFRHRDFTVPGSNGQQTRIKALLDMTVYNSQAPPLPPDPNWNYILPGASAPIGHLYTEGDINAALAGSGIIQQRNKTGHGTHVAGTAAGNGLAGPVPGKYAGMAPEADLVVVKASRQNDGTDNFLEADQINALAFVRQKAAELNEPFVINLSMAGHFGSHDGTRANERAIDEIVNSGSGRAVCVSGGSTGDMHAHASGNVTAGSDLNVKLNLRGSTQLVWLSYANDDSISVNVTRADGVQTGFVPFNANLAPGASNQYLDVYNTADDKRDSDPLNDQKAIIVILKPGATTLGPPPHTWTVTLRGNSIANGHFDAWASLEGDFIDHIDDTRQTTVPGTARGAITVGGYVTRSGDNAIGNYASFSSSGPTADGRLKPEISAPAFVIYSSKAEGSLFFNSPLAPDSSLHVGAFGNSFATPAVTGAVALLLQSAPTLTSDQIKQLVERTATHDSFTGAAAWHDRFGFGKLNIQAALSDLAPPQVQFGAPAYSVAESSNGATILVTRSGDTSSATTVSFATTDDPASIPCNDTITKSGVAFARCDYATTVDTVIFASGETAKNITIPLIDDSYVEITETVELQLTNVSGGILGTQNLSNLLITDNDTAGQPNPVFSSSFFVRQHYLDFLSREPDSGGFSAWVNLLNSCADVNNVDPTSPSAQCDRLVISSSFFGSQEFQLKGYYVYRFYKLGLNRLPTYAEIIPDMRLVTGNTAEEVFQKKAAYANAIVQRQEFITAFGALSNDDFVNALMGRYQLTSITTPDPAQPDGSTKVTITGAQLVTALNTSGVSRAQVVRAIADSDQVFAQEFNRAFVAMQYYGYLRRTPESGGYDAWLNYLNLHPSDFRTMINGFMNSTEYRLRFGQP